jgi:hypothetical protein
LLKRRSGTGIEFQPGALGILLQQAQPFQATACTLTDQLNPILQLAFVRRPDPLKSGRPVIAIAVYAIQEQGEILRLGNGFILKI